MLPAVQLLLPLGLTALLVLLFRPLALRIGLVDVPNSRKRHEGAVPLVGGIAVFCAFLFAVLTSDLPLSPWKPLFAAAAVMLIVGVLDDFKELSVRQRFTAQIGAVLMFAWWGGRNLQGLGDLLGFGPIDLGAVAIPFTVFGAVGVMNAVNMIDGMDGLSSGLLLIALMAMDWLLWSAGLGADLALMGMVTACVLGFFLLNFRFRRQGRAFAFLGDSGALFLGITLAYAFVNYSQAPYQVMRPVTALWLFAIPLMDTVSIMIRRARRGGSPFDPDNDHLHHVCQRAGLSVRRAAALIFLLQLLCAVAGIAGERYGVPEYLMFYAFMTLFAAYSLAMSRAWRLTRMLRRLRSRHVASQESVGQEAGLG